MKNDILVSNIGEIKIIELIEDLIFQKTGEILLRDDSFFFSLKHNISKRDLTLVLNSDMLVSTTDVPVQMSYYQVGRKVVLMNISDLIVKGVKPEAIIISLGLPKTLKVGDLKEIIMGIINCCVEWKMSYIGGDINESKELIINPTVIGFQEQSQIIHRNGCEQGDLLIVNGKFGLTGVGFDILLEKEAGIIDFPEFKRSIKSVIEMDDIGREGLILARKNYATASIDSSDGLAKSLIDLMRVNPHLGFEIEFNEALIDSEARKYATYHKLSLEELVLNAGEEFIHLFTLNPKKYERARKLIEDGGGNVYKIGRVISEPKIYLLKEGKRVELLSHGFEHFK